MLPLIRPVKTSVVDPINVHSRNLFNSTYESHGGLPQYFKCEFRLEIHEAARTRSISHSDDRSQGARIMAGITLSG